MRDRFTRIALLIAIILLIGFVAEPYIARLFYAEQAPRAVTPRGDLAPIERTNVELFERAAPSVVHVFAQARARRSPSSRGGGRRSADRHRLRLGRRRPHRHEQSRGPEREPDRDPAQLRRDRPRRARRHGAELRSRRAAPRQGSPAAARDRGRHLERPQGRAVRLSRSAIPSASTRR